MILTRHSQFCIFGVPPFSEDYLLIERDLTANAVEVNFASHVAKYCDREKVVDESRKMESHACIWW
jgi:hypothetical protein